MHPLREYSALYCESLTRRVLAEGLAAAAVEAEVGVSEARRVPVAARVGVQHVHGARVARVQPQRRRRADQRPRRVQACRNEHVTRR